MKKIIAYLMIVVLFVTIIPQNILADEGKMMFSVETVSGKVGDTVEVAINIKNNPGITAFQLDVGYSPSCLKLKSVEDKGLLGNAISTGSIENNPLKVSWFSNASDDKNSNGTLAVLKFEILNSAKSSEVTLSCKPENVFNIQFEEVAFEIENGRVDVEEQEVESDKYLVMFDGGEGASGAAPSIILGEKGSVITLPENTFANGNLAFDGWLDGDVLYKEGDLYTIPDHDVVFEAKWNSIKEYTMVSSSNEGGLIRPLGEINVEEGSEQRYTIAASSGYSIEEVLVDGESVGVVSEYVFENISGNHTIEAKFKKNEIIDPEVNEYTIHAEAKEGGIISPEGNITVKEGTEKRYTIIPSDGYKIKDIVVDGKSVGAISEYTFYDIKENHSIEASFIKIEPEIVKVESIILNQNQASMEVGELLLLKASVSPENADQRIKWSTSDAEVASVIDGKVTAYKEGTAQITAEAQDGSGVIATCMITVKSKPPVVNKIDVNDLLVSSIPNQVYSGKEIRPLVEIKAKDGTLLNQNTDYILSYDNNINVGISFIKIVGIGNYTGERTIRFSIVENKTEDIKPDDIKPDDIKTYKIDISNFSINSIPDQFYTGKILCPAVEVKDQGQILINGADYYVSYRNNVIIGTAVVTVYGIRNYTGRIEKTFNICADKKRTYTIGKEKYKITSSATADYVGVRNKKIKKVVVPKTIRLGGKIFKVTKVSDKALKGNKNLRLVKIGSNVKTIGKNAFFGCSKLKKVIINSKKLTKIGKNAFKGIRKDAKFTLPKSKQKKYGKMIERSR